MLFNIHPTSPPPPPLLKDPQKNAVFCQSPQSNSLMNTSLLRKVTFLVTTLMALKKFLLFSYLPPSKSGLQSNNPQLILFLCYFPLENLAFSSTTFRNFMFVWHLEKVSSTGVWGGFMALIQINCRPYAILVEGTKIMLIIMSYLLFRCILVLAIFPHIPSIS